MGFEVIDFHAHLPDDPQEPSTLLSAYDRAGITRGVVVPGNMLDSRGLADYMRGKVSLKSNTPDNDNLLRATLQSSGRLHAFFNADPAIHDPDDIVRARGEGFKGFKFNPLVLRTDLRRSDTRDLVKAMEELEGTLYTHITLQPQADLSAVVDLAREHPRLSIVLGHMGFATADLAAIHASQRFENLFLETSIGSVLALREVKKRGLARKLVFGSEYPLHDPEIELRKVALEFNDSELEWICSATPAHLLRG